MGKETRILPPKALIAVIALKALPGAPDYAGSPDEIIEAAIYDLEQYKHVGVDAVIIENDFDVPYVTRGPSDEALEVYHDLCESLRQLYEKPLGIQILEACNDSSLRLAAEHDFDFIRCEGYVYGHVGSAGIIEGCAGDLLRLRKKLDAPSVKIFADVKKKHCAHAMTSDQTIEEHIKQAELFSVDGVIVTSQFTGDAPILDEVCSAAASTSGPLFIGSGMTPENIATYLEHVDGVFVGSCLRKEGRFLEALEYERLSRFVEAFREAC